MKHTYKPTGTCSTKIDFEIDDGLVHNVRFTDGCAGNLRGMSVLAEGRPAAELVRQLKGTPCGTRGTSCPDQFARALEQALASNQ
jgi:uncharacterized protein (TIGR03905 family)